MTSSLVPPSKQGIKSYTRKLQRGRILFRVKPEDWVGRGYRLSDLLLLWRGRVWAKAY